MSRENDGRDKHTGTIKLKLSTFIFCSAKKISDLEKFLCCCREMSEMKTIENSNGLNMEFVYKI